MAVSETRYLVRGVIALPRCPPCNGQAFCILAQFAVQTPPMWTPDELDIRIIRAMASPASYQWDVRISYSRLSNRLGVDAETIRARLRRMVEVGFLVGWQLVLNPSLLEREAAVIELRLGETPNKNAIITQLGLVEGVTLIEDFYGHELAVHLLFRGAETLDRQVDLIGRISGCGTPRVWILGIPACNLSPTPTDWKIMHGLRRQARVRLSDLAQDLSLATRTVKRRVDRLAAGNAFYLDPVLDLKNAGGIRGRFWIVSDPAEKRNVDSKILAEVASVISTHTAPKEYSLFVTHCSNAFQIQDIFERLPKIPGVREVRANLEIGHLHVQPWLLGEIERKIPSIDKHRTRSAHSLAPKSASRRPIDSDGPPARSRNGPNLRGGY